MCGIAGIIDYNSTEDYTPLLSRMLGSIRHRGPDSFGIYNDRGAWLASTRLSIIDLNTGDQPIQNIFITDPIPFGTEFVHPSATELKTGDVEYSIDGGKTFHSWPILVKKTNDEGEEEMVEATPDMVTHLRWALTEPVNPKQGITVTYRTVIK